MSERFFVEQPITSATAVLTGQEAQHLAKVMRARVGDAITVFDGAGDEFGARVTQILRSEVHVEILERRSVSRELSFTLTLGVALPKGDRQKWLVEKLTELGVARLVPLVTSRGVAQPEPQALVRLSRTVVEGAKQCGRNRLMAIAPPANCRDFFTQESSSETLRLFAHPSGEARPFSSPAWHPHVLVAVGPEGGFTDEEAALAVNAGWQAVTLGARILRVETAAVALAAALSLG